MSETVVGSIVATVGLKSTINSDLAGITAAFSSVGSKVTSLGSSIGATFGSTVSSGLSKVESSFTGLTTKASALGSQMGIVKTAIVGMATAQLVSGFQEATSTFMQFDDAMRRVSAAIGASKDDFASLSEFAKTAGTSMGYTATETANAMVLAAQAGLDMKEIYAGIPAILGLARAGATDLGTAVKVTTSIMTNYNLTAEDMGHIGDVIAQGANESTAEITEFANSLKYAAQAAAPLNVSLEETTALLMAAADAGIRGSTAGTNLRMAFTRMITPTNAAVGALSKYGLTANDINLTSKDLAEVVDVLNKKHLSLADSVTIFGQRAGPMMYAIIKQGSAVLKENTAELENNLGYMEKMTDEMQGGLGGAVRELKAAFESLKIEIGEDIAFFIKPMITAISKLTTAYSLLPDWVQKTVVAFAGLATIGLSILTVLGTLGVLIGGVGTVMGALHISGAAVAAALSAWVAPIALVGVALLYLEEKTGLVSGAFSLLYDMGRVVWYGLASTISQAISDVSGYLDGFKAVLSDVASDLGLDGVVASVGTAWDNIKSRWADGVQNVGESADRYEAAFHKMQESTEDAAETTLEAGDIAYDSLIRWSDNAWDWAANIEEANYAAQTSIDATSTTYEKAVADLMNDVNTKVGANIEFMSGTDLDQLTRGIRTVKDELIILNDANELVKVSADGMITPLKDLGTLTFETPHGSITIFTEGLTDAQIESGYLDKIINEMGNDVVILDNTKLDNLQGEITDATSDLTDSQAASITWQEAMTNANAFDFGALQGEVSDTRGEVEDTTSSTDIMNSTFINTNGLVFSTIQANVSTVGELTDDDTKKVETLNTTLNTTNYSPFSNLFGNLGTAGIAIDTDKKKTDDANTSLSKMGGFSFSTTITSLGNIWTKLDNIWDKAKAVGSELFKLGSSSGSSSSGSSSISGTSGVTKSGGSGTGEGNVKVVSTVNKQTINYNGDKISASNAKSAGL